jgi:hypothetical protein
MKETTLELIETVIFWEKHTEIYDSLEKFIGDRYVVYKKGKGGKGPVRELISEFINAQMEREDDFRKLDPKIFEKYTVTKNDSRKIQHFIFRF